MKSSLFIVVASFLVHTAFGMNIEEKVFVFTEKEAQELDIKELTKLEVTYFLGNPKCKQKSFLMLFAYTPVNQDGTIQFLQKSLGEQSQDGEVRFYYNGKKCYAPDQVQFHKPGSQTGLPPHARGCLYIRADDMQAVWLQLVHRPPRLDDINHQKYKRLQQILHIKACTELIRE